MKKMNMRERIMTAAVLVAVPCAYFSMVSQKQSNEILTTQAAVATTQQALQTSQATLVELELKAAVAQKSLNANDEVKRYLESNKYMSNLLRKLGADEEDNGLFLKDITIENNNKENNFYRSAMKVQVESTFVALGNFLGKLSDSETLIDVKSVELNRIDSDLKRCTATIQLQGYFNEGPKL